MTKILKLKTYVQDVAMNGELTVISLFAGCGGSSLGYKQAGFKELLAVDFDLKAVEIFKLNFPEVSCWKKDIRDITGQEILTFCKIEKGELDVLDGSPPCQGFSVSGKRQIHDDRNNLVFEFIRLINELQPKAFVMENVGGLVIGKMKGIFKEIMRSFKKINYYVECRKLNAMWYNVPQSRERLIWIGARDKKKIEWPQRKKIISLREALENVPSGLAYNKMKGKQVKIAKMLKPGQIASCILGEGKWFNHGKASWNQPVMCINANAHVIYHPDRLTPFTIPELKRIFTFPDNFILQGTWREQAKVLGNSVPPKMMKAIATSVKEIL